MGFFHIYINRINKYLRSISFHLLKAILLVSSIITLLITAFQLFLDYRQDINFIENQFRQIEKSHLESVAMTLWTLDQAAVKTQLKGFLGYRDIIYLVIYDPEGKPYMMAGEMKPGKTVTRKYPLLFQGIHIGTLEITASIQNVYGRIFDRVFIIFMTQMLKTLIVSMFILFIVRQIVTRHLTSLGEYAKHLDLSRLDAPLILKKRRRKQPDELDLVAAAMNTMRITLRDSADALKKKARMEGELQAAAEIQKFKMPEIPPHFDGWDIAFKFSPALEVSGDYYDVFAPDENHFGLVIADASGKGLAAALHVNAASVLLKDKMALHSHPDTLLSALNQSIKNEFPANQFMTMSYARIEIQTGDVTYTSAGHDPALLAPVSGGTIIDIKPNGYPFCNVLSNDFDTRLAIKKFTMQPGDLLVLYTDGLTDSTNQHGKRYGVNRFLDLISDQRHRPAADIIGQTFTSIHHFSQGTPQNDDITMIAVKRLQSPA